MQLDVRTAGIDYAPATFALPEMVTAAAQSTPPRRSAYDEFEYPRALSKYTAG
jgi:hypothetical protein